MRAAFMTDVNAVEVRETEEPKLDPRGAILRVEACGICGTDARTFFNGDPRAPAPWVLGHEPVGVLEEVGPEAVLPPGVAKGDRVFLGSILTCGECRWCMEGFQNLCEHHLLYGYDPFPGAYAEWAAVPPIATKNLIPLPDDLPSDLATVADPFACALNGIEMLDVRLGDTVVILGTGPIGCWQAVMARDRGASRIYMTDVQQRPARHRDEHRRLVRRRRVGRRRGQRRRGGAREDRRCRRGAGQRRGAVQAGAAGRAGDGGQAREGRLLRRAAEARPGEPARHEPAPLQGARDPRARTARRTASTGSRWTTSTGGRRTWPAWSRTGSRSRRSREAFETIRSGTGLKMVIVP